MALKIIDSHFHVFDIDVRNGFPNQNESMGFPDGDIINRSHTVKEAVECMDSNNVGGAVFVQCYNDCPEEIDWIYQQVQNFSFEKKTSIYLCRQKTVRKSLELLEDWTC